MPDSDLFYLAPETDAGERQHNLVLPVSLSKNQLDLLYDRFLQKTRATSVTLPLHIIAVPNSGIAIATYFFTRYTVAHPKRQAWISIIDQRRQMGLLEPELRQHCYTVLVDNSVKTGRTLMGLSGYLDKVHIHVDEIFKLIDYDDDQERKIDEILTKKYHAPLYSLYSFSELDK
jgi:hypothetical protein